MHANETKSFVKIDPVVVEIDRAGNVKSVRKRNGISVPYIQEKNDEKETLISEAFLEKTELTFEAEALDEKVVKQINDLISEVKKICVFPGVHIQKRYQHPRCCVLEFDCSSQIDPSRLPLDISYATCVSICEIDNRLGTLELGEAHFNSEEFKESFLSLKNVMYTNEYDYESSNCPGVLGKGKLHDAIKRYCLDEDTFWNDPLKRVYRPEFLNDWTPFLVENKEDHFISICSCDWKMMNERVKNEYGHGKNNTRYYLMVGWSIPVSLCDQLKHCVKVRGEEGHKWGDMVSDGNLSYEMISAEHISRASTEHVLSRTLKHLGLKQSHNFNVSSYVSNVFRHNSQTNSLRFYNDSLCVRDETREGGVLTMRGASPEDGFIWWGGEYVRGKRLGSAWSVEKTMNGFPSKVFNVVDGVENKNVDKQYVWGNIKDRNKDFQPSNSVGFMKLENIISI